MRLAYSKAKAAKFPRSVIILILLAALTALCSNAFSISQTIKTDIPARTVGSRPETEVSKASLNQASSQFQYPRSSRKMQSYFWDKYLLVFLAPLYSSAIILFLLQSNSAKLLLAQFQFRPGYFQLCLYTTCFYYVSYCLFRLPINFYSSYFLEQKYGLSHETLIAWGARWLTSFALEAFCIPLIAICFWLVRRYHRHWWLAVFALLAAITLSIAYIEPIAIDPLYNKFKPLPESSL
ncbi:MAG: hypothetical protein K2X27_15105, partial [Candidatus Obscuribacterales bacterium]|nr:hypothetical protein [Candidatus Obscuribacterales bacterium]